MQSFMKDETEQIVRAEKLYIRRQLIDPNHKSDDINDSPFFKFMTCEDDKKIMLKLAEFLKTSLSRHTTIVQQLQENIN